MDTRECCMDLDHAIANEIESIPIDVVSLKALGLRDLSELVRLLVRPFIVCLSVFFSVISAVNRQTVAGN